MLNNILDILQEENNNMREMFLKYGDTEDEKYFKQAELHRHSCKVLCELLRRTGHIDGSMLEDFWKDE